MVSPLMASAEVPINSRRLIFVEFIDFMSKDVLFIGYWGQNYVSYEIAV